jgi:hypothetical protein
MRAYVNRWQVAICEQLEKSASPLSTSQIWDGMVTAGFQHKSAMPRSTLGARLAELVEQGAVDRVGPSLYQISCGLGAVTDRSQQEEQRPAP